jgi:hypothetical protein
MTGLRDVPESVEQNLQSTRVLGQLEKPHNANNREELQVGSGAKPGGQAEIDVESQLEYSAGAGTIGNMLAGPNTVATRSMMFTGALK